MNIDALAGQACLLHDAFKSRSPKLIDEKIQQIQKEYSLIKPESAASFLKLYRETNISGLEREKGPIEPEKLKQIESAFFKILSKDIPDLDKRIQSHDHFMAAFERVFEGDNFEELEQILKETPIDLNACKFSGESLLWYAFEVENINLLKFLLEHGAKVQPEDMSRQHSKGVKFYSDILESSKKMSGEKTPPSIATTQSSPVRVEVERKEQMAREEPIDGEIIANIQTLKAAQNFLLDNHTLPSPKSGSHFSKIF